MGCSQSSAECQRGGAPSPISGGASPVTAGTTSPRSPVSPVSPTSPQSRARLVKYRTLLTGQTMFDASGSKAASKANSRCTSRASFKSDEEGSFGAVLGERELFQALSGGASPRSDCSPMGRDAHFVPQMAAQAGRVSVEDLLFAARLASVAYAGNNVQGNGPRQQMIRAALQVAMGGKDLGPKPLEELVSAMGLTLDRHFSHSGGVRVQGYVAHSEADLVLAYSSSIRCEEADATGWANTAEFGKLTEGTGLLGLFECCTGVGNCSGRAPSAHEGYLAAALATVPDLEQELLPRLRAKKPVRLIVTGHGVGGAIAMGALAYILRKVDIAATPHHVLFVSAGQPKFGDCPFRARLEAEVLRLAALNKCSFARLIHDRDPVPAGPPGMPMLAHVGVPHVLTEQGEVLLGEEALGSIEVNAAELSGEQRDMHQPARYLELLGSQVRRPVTGE